MDPTPSRTNHDDTFSVAESYWTASSSSTVPGPGAISGKFLKAIGETTLDVVVSVIIRRRLRAIKRTLEREPMLLRNPSGEMERQRVDAIFSDLMELVSESGRGYYSTSTRKTAAILVQSITLITREVPDLGISTSPTNGRWETLLAHVQLSVGTLIQSTTDVEDESPSADFESPLDHLRQTADSNGVWGIGRNVFADTGSDTTNEEPRLLTTPWEKQGMLCRKQYWEATGRRAKSKAWQDVFVVLRNGVLTMFIFGKGVSGGAESSRGGSWLANAQELPLAHSLAHDLPAPGYNLQRPYCFVLTLATGGVFFFQVGSEEELDEWVSTCNYWAARQSTLPDVEGLSVVEHGWDILVRTTRGRFADSDDDEFFSDPLNRVAGSGIKEWKPLVPSIIPSSHDEEAQFDGLQKQLANIKEELQIHNQLRGPAYRSYNAHRTSLLARSIVNWETRSRHLLTEIVKYEIYFDSLKKSTESRLKQQGGIAH